jgi:dihydropteroate synthase
MPGASPAVGICWRAGRFTYDVGRLARPLVMGIINVTPDSFSDGGQHIRLPAALNHAERLFAEGADILDIGGESTRPGAPPVPLDEERRRVLPVLEALAARGACVSVDTRHPALMREAIVAGASIINDVQALTVPGAIEVCAAANVGVVLMHMQGQPLTMQQQPRYADVVAEVQGFLAERVAAATQAGIADDRLLLDPGFGFGKTLEHNLALFRALDSFAGLNLPLLIGVSRKSMLGGITGQPLAQRLAASVSAALLAAQRGARILRVHDVAETRDALAVWHAVDPYTKIEAESTAK